MVVKSALKVSAPEPTEPTNLEIFASLVVDGMALVEAGQTDIREHFIAIAPEPILSREDLPALETALKPLTDGDAKHVARHRKLYNVLRAVAILGGDDMQQVSSWATDYIDDGKVGEVKSRKGSASSLAVAIEREMIEGRDFEDARRMATSGKNADDGAYKIALGKLESLMESIGKLRPALMVSFDDEKMAAFDNWVIEGRDYAR